MPEPPSGSEVIASVRARTDTILLAFSRGKDSIAAWLECRKHFPRIVPFYLYRVPGLEFVERSLAYYEEFFGQHIIRLPHPATYGQLKRCIFQPPDRIKIIQRFGLASPDYGDMQDIIRDHQHLGPECYGASGIRASDSIVRRLAIHRYGAVNDSKRQFFPVWDWDKARLLSEIHAADIKLPVDYRLFGRSFDGLDYRFLAPIKEHFPRDYARILEWFPLAELEILRRKYAEAS